jgi:hypothetical protein
MIRATRRIARAGLTRTMSMTESGSFENEACYQAHNGMGNHPYVCRGCNAGNDIQQNQANTMNPNHQQFLTDEWQPPDRECNTTTMVDEEGASIVVPDTTGRWIRTEGLVALSDNR